MMPHDPKSGGNTHPGKAPVRLDRGDLPHGRWEPGLTNQHPAPDGECACTEWLHADNRRRPFVPAIDVAHHLPHALGRRVDVDGDGEFSHRIDGRLIPYLVACSNACASWSTLQSS